MLGENIKEVGHELNRSIGSEMLIHEKVQQLDTTLANIEGLTEDERDITLSKILDHPTQMLVFFSLLPSRRLAWVKRFISMH